MKNPLYLIIAAAVALRLLAALYLGNAVEALPGTFDQISYHNLALRLLDGHGFTFATNWWPITPAGEPTAHWSYLYTFYLAAIYRLFGPLPIVPRLLQAAIVGVLHPLLAYLIGRRVAGERVGLIAALLTAFYAYFIYYSAILMTEPFYITAVLAALYLTLQLPQATGRRQTLLAIALGLNLSSAILLRQLVLLLVPILLLWWWWTTYRQQSHIPLRSTLLVAALIAILILPFTFYNYARFDQFVLLNTNAGYAFFWANHPIYGTQFESILPPEMGTYQDLIPQELRHLDEAALDRALLQRGLSFVVEDPVRYIRLSISRIAPYFMFWPSADSGAVSNVARMASFGLLWPFMASGVPLALRRARRDAHGSYALQLILIFAAAYTAIHLLSWALIRYRLPVDAVLIIPAAVAIAEILKRLPLPGPYIRETKTA